jgi:hypothetical protein
MNPNLSYDEAVASMAPITDYMASPGQTSVLNVITTVSSYTEAFDIFIGPSGEAAGVGSAVSSRLIPKSAFSSSDNQAALLAAISKMVDIVLPLNTSVPGSPLQILVTAPASYALPAGYTSAVTPAWRDSYWHFVTGQGFENEAGVATINAAFKNANAAAQPLRDLYPDSGAYQNEADVFEPDPVASFWGEENYARLSQIKKEVDPQNLLTCWDCVGWDKDDDRYACYPSIA